MSCPGACVALPVIAREDESKIQAAMEARFKEWLAAENKKDAEMLTNLYGENAALMVAAVAMAVSPIRGSCSN